jgi:bifunctional non-homologous end joining protein LigD
VSKRRAATHRSPARFIARTLPGAKPAPFPGFIDPCLPTLKPRVPKGVRWVHEIKHDGYRVQGHLVCGVPALFTRRGHDWTHRMSAVAGALANVPASHLVVDGEVIVPDTEGRGDFSAVETALGNGWQSHRMLFYDLLQDHRRLPCADFERGGD